MELSFYSSAIYFMGAFATYIALFFSYRLLLHSLRDYPGPILAKVSDVYDGIHAASMSLHLKTREGLLEHGPVIRHGPNRLVFSSLAALTDIYQNERIVKSHLYKHTAVTDGRGLIGQAISERSMRIFEPTMIQQIDSSVSMIEKLKRLGIDTFPLLKKIRIYSFLELSFAKEVRKYFTAIEHMIASRAGAVFSFPARGDTTSTLLATTFFCLSRNRSAYENLAREIRSGPVLAGCKYLRAWVDETMRMSPPAPGTLWRELSSTDTSPEPWIMDGHIIPPGVQAGVNTYATHHNEEIFPDSFDCARKAIAYVQSSIVLAKTIYLGKLGAGGPDLGKGRDREEEYQLYEVLSASHDGPSLEFYTRSEVIGELSN
ncbi:cytochrome P450 [Xylaria telfairii]|nr:cytochrome P450 [Xylaria telfairii]